MLFRSSVRCSFNGGCACNSAVAASARVSVQAARAFCNFVCCQCVSIQHHCLRHPPCDTCHPPPPLPPRTQNPCILACIFLLNHSRPCGPPLLGSFACSRTPTRPTLRKLTLLGCGLQLQTQRRVSFRFVEPPAPAGTPPQCRCKLQSPKAFSLN